MIDGIRQWLYNIILFIIFSSLLLQICAAKKYEKYVRFFSGIILVILVVSPVVKWLGSDNLLEFSYLSECFSQAAADASSEMEGLNELQNNEISNAYKEQIQLSLENILNAYGYRLVAADITLESDKEKNNYFYPDTIKVRISMDLTSENDEKSIIINKIKLNDSQNDENSATIKKTIADFFGIKEECVDIEIV